MKVLVVNVGSTSIKYNLYEMNTESRLASGRVERIGTPNAEHFFEGGSVKIGNGQAPTTAADAQRSILGYLMRSGGPLPDASGLGAVGHRVVHGGEQLIAPVQIDDKVEEIIAAQA